MLLLEVPIVRVDSPPGRNLHDPQAESLVTSLQDRPASDSDTFGGPATIVSRPFRRTLQVHLLALCSRSDLILPGLPRGRLCLRPRPDSSVQDAFAGRLLLGRDHEVLLLHQHLSGLRAASPVVRAELSSQSRACLNRRTSVEARRQLVERLLQDAPPIAGHRWGRHGADGLARFIKEPQSFHRVTDQDSRVTGDPLFQPTPHPHHEITSYPLNTRTNFHPSTNSNNLCFCRSGA